MNLVRLPDRLFAWGSRNRILFSAVLSLIFLALARPTAGSLLLSLPLVLAGEGVRFWASGHIDKDRLISREGPYSLSRNPLYVGNFLIGLGFMAGSGRWWLVAGFVLLFAALYRHTVANEEGFLSSRFPGEWRAYSAEVPRWLPLGKVPPYLPGAWSLARVRRHRELRNLPVFPLVYLLLAARAWLFAGKGW